MAGFIHAPIFFSAKRFSEKMHKVRLSAGRFGAVCFSAQCYIKYFL